MSLVEIVDVTLCGESDVLALAGYSIDLPEPNTEAGIYEIDIAGWVLGPDGPPDRIELSDGAYVLQRAPLDLPRPDVAKFLPRISGAEHSGFWISCGVIGLATAFEIHVEALFADDVRVRIGTIRGRHQAVRSGFEPTLQPLMLTSLSRSGTTWLMRLLSEHPAIVSYNKYPNEVKCAGYWIHMFSVLSRPANWLESAHPETFDSSPFWLGHHPFHSVKATGEKSSLRNWFGCQYIEDLAAFCQRMAENFYSELAQTQGRTGSVYFAEKQHPDQQARVCWNLYPSGREIFLVRDFRDMLCSIFAFNAQRGFVSFGRDLVADDAAYVNKLQTDAQQLVAGWKERSDRTHLVRYEDLILHPECTLEGILKYLDLDRSAAVIRQILERAAIDTPESRLHRTSADPRNSIGRWRTALDPGLRRQCDQAFATLLREFDYDRQTAGASE